eukprot:TRINITY_DN3126_c0_g1_i1.p1 TRINITY_DN3126_c0_g1~~TRINITY_DN3126_c0_g1_i1.p1  ORF type:complete len:259 (+),score=35.87 TRINITY_DN3126_c0_g1_i1:64-840(+)
MDVVTSPSPGPRPASPSGNPTDPAQYDFVKWANPEAPSDPKKTRRFHAKNNLPPVDPRDVASPVQPLLDQIIPPQQWTDPDGTQWIRRASTIPGARVDVVRLNQRLHNALEACGATDAVGDPRRAQLHDACFSELLRQTTAECPERGAVLLRVHRALLADVATLRRLLVSRSGFTLRQALRGEADVAGLRRLIEAERKRAEEIAAGITAQKATMSHHSEAAREARVRAEMAQIEEMSALRKECTAKKQQLEALVSVKR